MPQEAASLFLILCLQIIFSSAGSGCVAVLSVSYCLVQAEQQKMYPPDTEIWMTVFPYIGVKKSASIFV